MFVPQLGRSHSNGQAMGRFPRRSDIAQLGRLLGWLAPHYARCVALGFVQFVGVPAAARIASDREKRRLAESNEQLPTADFVL